MSDSSLASDAYLQSTAIIDWKHPAVSARAADLASSRDVLVTARSCFEFVRDEIKHSRDFEMDPATCRASDVLRYGTGYCYAKSHLLAALLRANGIPAGFCYQRLSVNDAGPPYSLHGYNAIWLPEFGWFRVDARGNKLGIDAGFDPPRERLAFALNSSDEFDFANILAEPLGCVVQVLEASNGWFDALARLPDIEPEQFDSLGLTVRARGA
jgi:transglutaminase-like putative cysteine protease